MDLGALLALRLHHHVKGPPFDYVGLVTGTAVGWTGVPGAGEVVLIAAGVLAARHRLDIGSVVFAAWVGATAGGILGWLAGMKGGRFLVTAPGPFRARRQRALVAGERLYERHGLLAVYLSPAWMAGITRMRARRYLPANALSALLWALLVGLGAFFAGPPVAELAADLGLFGAAAVGLAALVVFGVRRWRMRH